MARFQPFKTVQFENLGDIAHIQITDDKTIAIAQHLGNEIQIWKYCNWSLSDKIHSELISDDYWLTDYRLTNEGLLIVLLTVRNNMNFRSQIRIVDIKQKRSIHEINIPELLNGLAISETKIVANSMEECLIWEIHDIENHNRINIEKPYFSGSPIAFDKADNLITSFNPWKIKTWDLESRICINEFDSRPKEPIKIPMVTGFDSLIINDDGIVAEATYSADVILVTDLKNKKGLSLIPVNRPSNISIYNEYLSFCDGSQNFGVWNIKESKLQFYDERGREAYTSYTQFSNDGLLITSYHDKLEFWDLTEDKKHEILERQWAERERQDAEERRVTALLANILKIVQQIRPNIPVQFSRIVQLSQGSQNEVEYLLKALVTNDSELGEYLEFEQVFIRKDTELNDEIISSSISKITVSRFGIGDILQICPQCEESQSTLIRECANCKASMPFCNLCKRGFSETEPQTCCPQCELPYHRNHLYAYVQSQGSCPVCKEGITIKQIE